MSYKIGDLVTLAEAAKLLASRDERHGESHRKATDRWRKRIAKAATQDSIRAQDGKYFIESIITWAKGREKDACFSRRLLDLPREPLQTSVNFRARASISAGAMAISGQIDALKEENARLWSENFAQKKRIEELEKELSDMRPKAQKYEMICRRNKESSKRRRRGE